MKKEMNGKNEQRGERAPPCKIFPVSYGKKPLEKASEMNTRKNQNKIKKIKKLRTIPVVCLLISACLFGVIFVIPEQVSATDLTLNDPPKLNYDNWNFELPKFQLPKIEFPKFELPNFELPKWNLPKFEIPEWNFPKFDPQFELPEWNLPKIQFPAWDSLKSTTTVITAPDIPKITAPDWDLLKSNFFKTPVPEPNWDSFKSNIDWDSFKSNIDWDSFKSNIPSFDPDSVPDFNPR